MSTHRAILRTIRFHSSAYFSTTTARIRQSARFQRRRIRQCQASPTTRLDSSSIPACPAKSRMKTHNLPPK
eukprot:3579670-Rhodomonas_salina.1